MKPICFLRPWSSIHVGRWWILKLAGGEMIGFILLPVVVFLLYFTWRVTKKDRD
jgi:heme/copper-type cytochrome/quinol oxidase subunit 2